jgi:hypothetical protein
MLLTSSLQVSHVNKSGLQAIPLVRPIWRDLPANSSGVLVIAVFGFIGRNLVRIPCFDA